MRTEPDLIIGRAKIRPCQFQGLTCHHSDDGTLVLAIDARESDASIYLTATESHALAVWLNARLGIKVKGASE